MTEPRRATDDYKDHESNYHDHPTEPPADRRKYRRRSDDLKTDEVLMEKILEALNDTRDETETIRARLDRNIALVEALTTANRLSQFKDAG